MALLNFNAANVQPDSGVMDALPTGWYEALADQSDIKPTKSGDGGAYLEVRFNITAPQNYAGRKVYARFTIRNSNPVAQDIGFKQLSAFCHAVGFLQVEHSEQLHNRPLKLRVKLKPADGQYEAGNDIAAYRPITEQVDLGPSASSAAPASAAHAFTPPPAPSFTPPAPGQQFVPNFAPLQQAPGAPNAAPPQQFVSPAQFVPPQQQQAPASFAPPQQQAQFVPPQQAQGSPQFAPQQVQQPVAQQQAPAQQTWQPPTAQQPWQNAEVQAGVQQAQAPQGAPAQQVQQVVGAPPVPPWMQQPAQ